MVPACLLYQGIEEVGMDLRADQDPRRGRAILPGVEKGGHGDALSRGRHVGVVEDDHGCFPSELEMDTLQVGGGGGGNFHPGPHAAGDRHHGRDAVGHQSAAGVAVAADHVEDPRRQDARPGSRPA